MIYPAFWAYQTNVKNTTGFSPFQLVHGVEAVTPVECEISSLKISIHVLPNMTELEERLIHLENLDEQCRDALTTNQAHKKRVKSQYDKLVKPRIFSEGELVLLWDQDKEPLGVGKFRSMWLGPYAMSKVLKKGAYELIDFEGNKLPEPRYGLYLKNTMLRLSTFSCIVLYIFLCTILRQSMFSIPFGSCYRCLLSGS